MTVKLQIQKLEKEKSLLFKNGYNLSPQNSKRNRDIVKELIPLYDELFNIQISRWSMGLSLD